MYKTDAFQTLRDTGNSEIPGIPEKSGHFGTNFEIRKFSPGRSMFFLQNTLCAPAGTLRFQGKIKRTFWTFFFKISQILKRSAKNAENAKGCKKRPKNTPGNLGVLSKSIRAGDLSKH
jgi:hypothetical protein